MCGLLRRESAVISLQEERTTDVGVILTATSAREDGRGRISLFEGQGQQLSAERKYHCLGGELPDREAPEQRQADQRSSGNEAADNAHECVSRCCATRTIP